MNLRVSIVIVNYNTAEILEQCVNSINKFEKTLQPEIIIVDNCSNDASKRIIEDLSQPNKNVLSIFLHKKTGFSGANNIGINSSSGDFIIIMNPDVILTEPVIHKLTELFKLNEKLGAVSPALIGTDGKFQYDYFQRYPSVIQYLIYQTVFSKFFLRFPKVVNRYISNHNIDAETGKLYFTEQLPCAFFLTSKLILQEAGMMDEEYELFFEDVDLSLKINKKYRLAVDTSAKVTHIGGSSLRTADNCWLYGKVMLSMNVFFDKHYSLIRRLLLKIFSVSNSILTISYEYMKGIFGITDSYRLKKHKYFLKLFKEKYL